MKNIAIFDEATVETLKYMVSYGYDREGIIRSATEKMQITDSFIREFKDDINSDIFSKSYMLHVNMIQKYPELFDFDAWVDGNNFDPMTIFDNDFYLMYGHKVNDDILNKVLSEKLIDDITYEQMNMYFASANLINRAYLFNRAINNLTDKQIEVLVPQIDISNITTSLYKRITPDMIKNIIDNSDNITLTYFLSLIMKTDNVSFAKEMLESIDREFINDAGSNDSLWAKIVEFLPEDLLSKAISLGEKYSPNSITYYVLAYCLKMKDFEEDDLTLIVSSFKRNNLITALANYAKARDYETLLLACALQ